LHPGDPLRVLGGVQAKVALRRRCRRARRRSSLRNRPVDDRGRQQTAQKDLVQTAVATGQFKTLASLLTKAGLTGTLAGKAPFTVFAPTDAAFAR
jgi:uncharacterized surface protein with fasciclin (FAS1) repeats